MRTKCGDCECVKSELDIFAKPPLQRMIQSGMWEEIIPTGSGTPIQFSISSSGDQYLDPTSTYLYVKCKILKADNTNLEESSKVAPCNNFLSSMWKEVVVELNGTKVSSSNILYPYRAYIETLLSYSQDVKESILQSQLFYKDTAGQLDNVETANSGYVSRNNLSKLSKPFEMFGKLHVDFFFQNRLLINGVNMKITLTPSTSDFCLIGSATAKLEIMNVALYVRRVNVAPEVMEGHISGFRTGANALYPIRRVETVQELISAGVSSKTFQNLKDGTMPKRVVIGMIENATLNGKIDKNPYNLKLFNLKEFKLSINGVTLPYKELRLNITEGEYIRAFHSIFTGIDKPEGNYINRNDWLNGYALFAFDLSPDLSCGEYFNLSQKGKLRLDLNFSQSLTDAITVICYMEFEDIIEITEDRKVLYEVS